MYASSLGRLWNCTADFMRPFGDRVLRPPVLVHSWWPHSWDCSKNECVLSTWLFHCRLLVQTNKRSDFFFLRVWLYCLLITLLVAWDWQSIHRPATAFPKLQIFTKPFQFYEYDYQYLWGALANQDDVRILTTFNSAIRNRFKVSEVHTCKVLWRSCLICCYADKEIGSTSDKATQDSSGQMLAGRLAVTLGPTL